MRECMSDHRLTIRARSHKTSRAATLRYLGFRRKPRNASGAVVSAARPSGVALGAVAGDVDEIATEVGYADGVTLRALLRRKLGRGVRELRQQND